MKVVLMIFFLLTSHALAKVQLELTAPSVDLKQGEIVSGKLILKDGEGQVSLGELKGKSFGKTIYFVSVNPLIGKNGKLESEIRFIFLAVPQTNSFNELINGEDFTITWDKFNVIPTQPVESFLLGDFDIPKRKKILLWMIIGLVLLAGAGGAFWYNYKIKKKQKKKMELKQLRLDLNSCKDYDDIVLMWQNKRKYLEHFPNIDEEFKTLEETLFKYQFKPSRTEDEVAKVLTAYSKFKNAVNGSFNGI